MTLGRLLLQGGWAMIPILLASFIALGVFIQRYIFYKSIGKLPPQWLYFFFKRIQAKNYAEALVYSEETHHPIAYVLGYTLQIHLSRPSRTLAEAQRVGYREIEEMERFLPLLAFIAQVTPLLGLLGTVIGMVKMFYSLQLSGMNNVDVSLLSSGIWQALLTTAAGLLVAAPSLAAHAYLTHVVDHFRSQLNDAVEQLLTILAPVELAIDDKQLEKIPEKYDV